MALTVCSTNTPVGMLYGTFLRLSRSTQLCTTKLVEERPHRPRQLAKGLATQFYPHGANVFELAKIPMPITYLLKGIKTYLFYKLTLKMLTNIELEYFTPVS